MTGSIARTLIPMFIAMDPFGGLPYFLAMTAGHKPSERLKELSTAIVTAVLALLAFLGTGHAVLEAMGITLRDFEVAGGVVVLALAIKDIISSGPPHEKAGLVLSTRSVGVVPLGIPLLAGPAAFTTEILLLRHYGLFLTMISVIFNSLVTAGIFYAGHRIVRHMKSTVLDAVGHFISLLLGAYGVMMIREGLGIRTIPIH